MASGGFGQQGMSPPGTVVPDDFEEWSKRQKMEDEVARFREWKELHEMKRRAESVTRSNAILAQIQGHEEPDRDMSPQ